MVDAAKTVLPETAITPAHDIEVTVAPSLTQATKLEPVRFAIYGDDGQHKVTVGRNAAGEFIASQQPQESRGVAAKPTDDDKPMATSLYASLYHAALLQGISAETIQQILRVHAYETDFRRRARGSDSLEVFFDLKDEDKGAESAPGDLLFTSVTVGGETQRYYRFRTPDGVVDYYDEYGNNSRKFLMRKPVRSDDVRIVSGFGVRFHPLLNSSRMHTGVDWAGPTGTPILAAGNGVIEEVGPKGSYGNYIRIKHANGYQTAYGHMSRFAPTSRPGAKVRQGQVIGYIGNTGLSTGPHVHFEVLVSNRYVDPMSIQVPREKKLDGKQLADFHRERARVDDLMRRPPVLVQQVDAH
jgi:murein DD-endopeptidase MepM/ murein hydrolase activator NlpD